MKRAAILFFALALLLAGCSKAPKYTLDKLPADYSLEDAKADHCVVFEDGDVTSGQSIWNDFFKAANKGKTATVRLVMYYTLGDPSRYAPEYYEKIKDDYPLLYLKDLTYNGKSYTIKGYEDGQLITNEYSYLVKYTGKPNSKHASFSKYTYYVLVNDNSVTWDDIEHGMLSSQSGDAIEHYRVYSDLVFK